jgi:hypothetical protein
MNQNERHKSYDYTQRLTFFVIGLEVVSCGYMLLNADKLSKVEYAPILYVSSGLSAFFGILWRYFYNETYHESSHGSLSHFLSCS